MTSSKVFFDDVLFAETFLYIVDTKRRLCRFIPNEAQRHFSRSLTGRDLVLKARHLGFSTFAQARHYRLGITQSVAAATISHEDKSTQKFRRMMDRFHSNMPSDFRPRRKYSNATVTTYPDFDSEIEVFTAGNINTGRGGTYTHIHGSEVAFWADPEGLVTGLMQGGEPHLILESTPNGASGYFFELCMEALDRKNNWTLHFYPWWWEKRYRAELPEEGLIPDDEIYQELNQYSLMSEVELMEKHGLSLNQISWRRGKIKDLKHKYIQEYAEDPKTCFLSSIMSYFGSLQTAYIPVMSVGGYQEGHRYIGGVDWGQMHDYTVLSIIDATTKKQVCLLRMREMSWEEMRRRIRLECVKWHVSYLWVELNAMRSNVEQLRSEFTAHGVSTRIKEFTKTNPNTHEIMSDLHIAVHESGLKLLSDPDQRHEMASFQMVKLPGGGWKLEAAPGAHDDIVVANALSWHGATRGGGLLVG